MSENDFWKYCANCGEELGLSKWPPIVEMTSDSGETLIHSFCDDECKATWDGDD